MSTVTLVNGGNSVTSFPAAQFSASNGVRTFQFVPSSTGFTGALVIEGALSLNPSSSEYVTILSGTFTGHTSNFSTDVVASYPTIRVRITSYTSGAITIYGQGVDASSVSGSQGSSPYTALIESSLKIAGNGSGFKINGTTLIPGLTTDDVYDANNPSNTLTTVLSGKQDAISGTAVTASGDDLNLMAGMASYGLTAADLKRVADTTVTTAEINYMSGVTSNVQTQLNTLSAAVPASLTGVTVSGTDLNTFFDATPSVKISDINSLASLAGTVSTADLAVFASSSGQFTLADLVKLNAVTSSATELNVLNGFTGSTADLNKIAGLSASASDINAIAGYAATGVTSTEIGHLSGLTQNVQAALSSIPTGLSSLTASASDLNILAGAAAGTGAFSGGSLSATELSYLNGVTSSIQTQLDAKRDTSATIGISEITGATISTTELNYLSGVTSNVQSQLSSITGSYLALAGGTMTGVLKVTDGSAAAPAIGFTTSATTGMFYNSGAIGMSLAGTAYADIATSGSEFGSIGTTGNPYLFYAGVTTSPHYTFIGDTGTGMLRSAAGVLEFDANSTKLLELDGTTSSEAVNIGGATATNTTVTVTGKFQGVKLLGSLSAQSVTATGATTVFTVPASRTAIVTSVVVVSGGLTGVPELSFGTGTNDTHIDAVTNTGLMTNYLTGGAVRIFEGRDFDSYGSGPTTIAAGGTFNIKVDTASSAGTVDVYVFGYEV